MANTFTAVVNSTELLDRAAAKYDKTNVLNKSTEFVNGEYRIMKVDIGGFGNYTKEDGTGSGAYAKADSAVTYETVKGDKIRSISINIDKFDNMEAQNKAFGEAIYLVGQKDGIERMARRHAKLATLAGTKKYEKFTSVEDLLKSLRATNSVENANWVTCAVNLFIDEALIAEVEDLDSYKSKTVLSHYNIIPVPASVLNSKITLGATNGWSVAEDSLPINYIAVPTDAAFAGYHVNTTTQDPETNNDAYAYKFNMVEYPLDAYVLDNWKNTVVVSLNGDAPASAEG